MNRKLVAGLGFVAVLALVAGAIALATGFGSVKPATAYPGWPTYVQTVPQGCHPVAPGAYTTICDSQQSSNVKQPATGSTVSCHPVAPGAFTQICTDGQAVPAPTPAPEQTPATLTCTPVAPGAFTEICARR